MLIFCYPNFSEVSDCVRLCTVLMHRFPFLAGFGLFILIGNALSLLAYHFCKWA